MPKQDQFRRCYKCKGLYYDGHPTKGKCPEDGGPHVPHDALSPSGHKSANYELHLNDGPAGLQWKWHHCVKCEGLWFAGDTTAKSHCPATGEHSAQGSGDYGLEIGGGGQPNWCWCNKC